MIKLKCNVILFVVVSGDLVISQMEYFADDIKQKFGVELFGNTVRG